MLDVSNVGERAIPDLRSDEAACFRQLRHLTKNALQRVIAEVSKGDVRHDAEMRKRLDDVERRMCLTAAISDALFGLTRSPGPFLHRLQSLCGNVVELLAYDQSPTLVVRADGFCPPHYAETVLRVAHEFMGNTLKHGLYGRSSGRIVVLLESSETMTVLTVRDDGWGFDQYQEGEGLSLARMLAAGCGGHIRLQRCQSWTIATLELPHGPVGS